jgi:hypothetical protein
MREIEEREIEEREKEKRSWRFLLFGKKRN